MDDPSGRLTPRRFAMGLAILAGLLAIWLSIDLFPYRSINHDEGVYLQQAAVLLDGKLAIDPPVRGALRPWFFVADRGVLYPKYAPVAAAIFAVGMALGEAALALGPVAAAVVWLTYATVAETFEPRVGVVASAFLVITPLFLIQSAVFLSYLPTLALLLGFAWAYLRADRTGDRRIAVIAGVVAGLAFFSRPYTTLLFATPFLAHAVWTLRDGRPPLERQSATALSGLLGVGLTLLYNLYLTGSPLRFPYQAIGPRDGPGFGRRELLGYTVDYDLDLALESAQIALSAFTIRWTVVPPVGVLLAALGLWLFLRRGRDTDPRGLVLAGLVLSIPLGQLAFWGTHNAIGNLADPGLGLMGHLGPFYHLPLLVPIVAFAAVAVISGWDQLRPLLAGLDSGRLQAIGLAGVIVLAAVSGLAGLAIIDVVDQNRTVTESHAAAYAPVEAAEFEEALLYLPTPQGNWLAHPFQYLRNEPDFDGPVVYAQDRRVFAVLDAFPNRQPYRYAYRGRWFPANSDNVKPVIRRLRTVQGERVVLDAMAGLPPSASSVTATLENREGVRTSRTITEVNADIELGAILKPNRANLVLDDTATQAGVPITSNDSVALTLFVDTGSLDSFEYVLELPVERSNGMVRSITPRQRVCSDVRHCGAGGAYIPGSHGTHVRLNASLSAP